MIQITLACLAAFYWNPPREAFTIPYFDIAVAWYGILFAGGFVVGYFIFVPMVQRLIWQNKRLYLRDIDNWSLFTEQFRNQSHFVALLPHKGRKELNSLPKLNEPSTELKQEILDAINNALKDPSSEITRKSLENSFTGSIATARSLSVLFTDRLVWFVVFGTVIGARLGHVFFYEWPYYAAHPIEILMIRKGGLASHGGTLGVIIGLILFTWWNRKKFPDISLLTLIDTLVVPTAFAVFCIRLGNFFNQEILGLPTSMPWGVIFGDAADGSAPVARHPVQLYEGLIYLGTFVLLYALWKWRGPALKPGTLSGIFFILVFGSRFFIEFLKELQGSVIDESFLQMGQYLSIPFVILGIVLLALPRKK